MTDIGIKTALRVLCVLLLCGVSAQPALAATAAAPNINVDDLRSRLDAAQTATSLTAELRTQVTTLYQQAIANLETAGGDRAEAGGYAQALGIGPAQLESLQRQLQQPPAPVDDAPDAELSLLEQRLLSEQADLLRLRAELSDVNAASLAEQEADVSALLAQAVSQQSSSQTELANPVTATPPALAEALRAQRVSAAEAANAHVQTLQQRLLSRDVRLALWDARQRLLMRQISAAVRRTGLLQDAINTARQQQAGAIARQTQEQVLELGTTSQVSQQARSLADENAELAARIAEVGARSDVLLAQQDRLQAERTRLARYFDSVSQQLAVAGANRYADLGVELLKQRKNLTNTQRDVPEADALDQEITAARIAQLRLEDRRAIAAEHHGNASSTELAQQLQSARDQLLKDASTAQRRYIDAALATRNERQSLATTTDQYRSLLDSRLFWIPSAAPVSWSLWRGLGGEISSLMNAPQWRNVTATISPAWARNAVLAIAMMLVSGAILSTQRRLKEILVRHAGYVGKIHRDRSILTWTSLTISLVLAAPGPLLLTSISMLLRGDEIFATQLGTALRNAAALWFLLEAYRQICRPDGVAQAHFKWSDQSLLAIRRHLPWLIRILVPVALFTPLLDASDSETWDALDRLLFAVASLALAYFGHRMLRGSDGAFAAPAPLSDTRMPSINRYVMHPLAVMIPLLLLALSWSGYHYTALELESRLFQTVLVLAGIVLLYFLALRALAVTERRMALDRLRAQRRADREQTSNRLAADDAAESVPDKLELPEYDLPALNMQTRAFLRMLIVLGAALALWLLWSDVLPALGVFNEIEMWRLSSADGQTPPHIVTLGDLVLAGALLFLTVFGARNLPGSLEIAVLRRLALKPGTSYAVTTLVKYFIVFSGVMVVLNLIGAQWDKVQWLVAALGVGLGFGLQEIVANFVSGLLILFERPIRVGDTITVGGHTGTVSRIRMRATTLMDWDRREQIIPNKTFITEQLTNWTLSDPITRIIIKVGVAYSSDVLAVHKVLTGVIADNTRVIADPPPAVFFVGFGDSSLDFEIRVFIRTLLDMMPLTHELHVAIQQKFRDCGIEIPFPQRDIWVRAANEGTGPPQLP